MDEKNKLKKLNENALLARKPMMLWEYRVYLNGSLLENGVALNDVATFIYQQCDGKNKIYDILLKICKDYKVKKEKAKKDLLVLIRDLLKEDAIKI